MALWNQNLQALSWEIPESREYSLCFLEVSRVKHDVIFPGEPNHKQLLTSLFGSLADNSGLFVHSRKDVPGKAADRRITLRLLDQG